ncbi:Trimethyllysine dioxygenase, partial [Aureobasidium melanogenum]
MAGNMSFSGTSCPLPFLSSDNYTSGGGYIEGRFCSDKCCLPCPLTELVYSDAFPTRELAAGWLSVVSLIASIFLLLTYTILPPEKSHRHYLSIGLIVSNVLLQLAIIVPLGSKPSMCYDAITPNDMYSDLSCAFSGALLLWGGMASVCWVLSRALWTHLRVCWNRSDTQFFLIASQIFCWGIPTILTAVCMKYTGVSYRLANVCLPNNKHTFTTYFGWMIAFASLAFVLQIATSLYCLHIYLMNLWKSSSSSPSRNTGTSSELPTSATTSTWDRPWKATRQQAWARVRRVFILQWRNILLCMGATAIVAMLSGVFVSLNTSLARDKARGFGAKEIAGWAACLVITLDKNQCLPLAKQLGITEAAVSASLIITGLTGLNTFALLMRWSTLVAWYELLRGSRSRRDSEDFLNAEPRRITFDQPLESETNKNDLSPVESPVESPVSAFFPGRGPESDNRDSLGGGSIQHRLNSDASAQPGRVSVFIEHPFDDEKQDLEPGKALGVRAFSSTRISGQASETTPTHAFSNGQNLGSISLKKNGIYLDNKLRVTPFADLEVKERPGSESLRWDGERLYFENAEGEDRTYVSNLWLRDQCPCHECVHPETRQRQLDTFSIDPSIKPTKLSIQTKEKQTIQIEWQDGHQSEYPLKVLRKGRPTHTSVQRRGLVEQVMFDKTIADKPPTVDYKSIMEADGIAEWTRQINVYGLSFVKDCPIDPEATQKLLEKIGPIRETHYGGFYDFTSNMASKDTAYTSLALEAHTDTTYFSEPAGLQMFHMLSHTDGSGGESLLVDGFAAARQLYAQDKEAYRILSTVGIWAHASGNEDVSIQPYVCVPVLSHDPVLGHLVQVRWNNSDRAAIEAPSDMIDKWYEAARKFNSILNDPQNQYWTQLEPGMPLIFDNWRVLHGRGVFTGKRRMAGGYINRDDFISKFKLTNSSRDEVLEATVTG